jgi:hypothetical protein
VDDLDVRGYLVAMRIAVAKLLLMLAVLLMPLGMTPAAAQGRGDKAMVAMGHCDQQAPAHHSTQGFTECTMACSAALPAFDVARDEPPPVACTPAQPVAAQILHGLHPETATPPPRIA